MPTLSGSRRRAGARRRTRDPLERARRTCHIYLMCNRFRMTEGQMVALQERYGVDTPFPPDLTVPPPELFPDSPAYVVRQGGSGRRLDVMRWGFPRRVPGKRVDPSTGKPRLVDTRVTNVRNHDSPFWRASLADPARRCLVPFTSFSEYGPGARGRRPLHWFTVPGSAVMSFAGVWRGTANGAVFAFLTTAPNPLVAPIHPQAMPVLLDRADEETWLDGDVETALALAQPYPSQLMRAALADDPRAVLEWDDSGGVRVQPAP